MTPQFANSLLRTALCASLLLPATTLLGSGCGQADPESTQALGANLTQLTTAKPTAKPTTTPSKTSPRTEDEPPKVDMSYLFKGSDADRAKLKIASFKPGMTKEQKLATVKNISAVLERMQADDANERIKDMPRAVRDGAAIWNDLSIREKMRQLEETNQQPNPGGDVSNWAAAAVGVAVAAIVYQVAKDEKWINDLELKDLQIRTFSVKQLDHVATLGKTPLMLPVQVPANLPANTH